MPETTPDTPRGPAAPLVSADAVRGALADRGLGPDVCRALEVLDETHSTNAVAIEAVSGAPGGARPPSGAAVLARHQTRARGRLERSWSAEPDSSILLSVIVRPETPAGAERLGLVPLAAGAAVARSLRERVGLHAMTKWPNDVLIGGRKVAGVLCQAVTEPGGLAVVVGVGLNVRQTHEQLPVATATSLAVELGAAAHAVLDDASELAADLVAGILAAAQAAMSAGDLGPVEAVMDTLGRRVRAELVADDPSRDVTGTAVGLDPSGGLMLRTDSGELVTVHAGDVWHMRPEEAPRTGHNDHPQAQPASDAPRTDSGGAA
ncbi:biotin--[acetyl-CoA-carboxylase] ligase [Falsarthrobacter nasiphocae]|uniref:biotin--[biotin carboxyl-carrier protein] ligase n=1 Tax=Falsarthrobacter nasiphocae TaxID=189863 RepID=A0AAE3YH29_9MICC|nr:biotin--[acetyl-CoA-carboxylase] ligase [Falsarthrobacter nasiphocae]MDR6892592.1 BirA family biotin operon repressor/biotin-[acetyl-CoA-carboxylase] ligase [Falsarthrobacter nasiphocae]